MPEVLDHVVGTEGGNDPVLIVSSNSSCIHQLKGEVECHHAAKAADKELEDRHRTAAGVHGPRGTQPRIS